MSDENQQQQELTESQLSDMAEQLDSTGGVDIPPEATPETEATPATEAAPTPEGEPPTAPEPTTQDKGPGTEAAEKQSTEQESAYLKTRKELERREKSWQKLEEEKAQLRKEREEVAAERQKVTQTAAPRDPSGHSADDYESAASAFEKQGDAELANRARSKAQQLRHSAQAQAQESQVKEFRGKWEETINKVVEEKPELKNVNSDLGKKVAAALRSNPQFAYVQDGFRRAVEHVELQDKAALVPGLRSEVERLKTENERLNKLTSVGGSGVMHKPGSASFDQMTRAEQEAELTRAAEEADRQAT